jgi:hypothetical protein
MMRFVRWMMILLGSFFVMAVLRTIMQAIQKGMADALGGDQKQPAAKGAAASPGVTPGGELKKCAACGVYNAASNSVTKVRDGVTVYYCSSECRGKAAASAA